MNYYGITLTTDEGNQNFLIFAPSKLHALFLAGTKVEDFHIESFAIMITDPLTDPALHEIFAL